MKTRATLILPVQGREQLREMYVDKGGLGGLFVEGDVDVPLGEPIDIEIHCVAEQAVFRIRGTARWRRAQATKKSVPPGVGIEFLADDTGAKQLLLDYMEGADIRLVERATRRYGVNVVARYKNARGERITEVTDDLSEGGAFIRSQHPLEVGSLVDIKLMPEGSLLGVPLKAVVAWRQTDGRSGFGVEFLFEGERRRAKLRRFLSGLKARVLRESRVKTVR